MVGAKEKAHTYLVVHTRPRANDKMQACFSHQIVPIIMPTHFVIFRPQHRALLGPAFMSVSHYRDPLRIP